jgi:hypothetical protein
LRWAFIVSETFGEPARALRVEHETPVKLQQPPTAILHLAPSAAFDLASTLDISPLLGQQNRLRQWVASGSYTAPRYNFDGLLANDLRQRRACYLQLFRNGIVEATLAD